MGRADDASPEELVHLRVLNEAEQPYERPQTRADCVDVPRPCPFVGCKHHLYLDYTKKTGNIRLNFPHLEPDQLPANGSCSLDVAEQGGVTLNVAGQMVNLTRERIRQVEAAALRKLRSPPTMGRAGNALSENVSALRSYADHVSVGSASPLGEQMVDTESDSTASAAEDTEARHATFNLPRFMDTSVSDEQYCASLHRVWDKWRSDRHAMAQGDRHVLGGHYLNDRQFRMLGAIRDGSARGQSLTVLELADEVGIYGTTSARRQAASMVLRSLREMGLLHGKNGQTQIVEKPEPQQKLRRSARR